MRTIRKVVKKIPGTKPLYYALRKIVKEHMAKKILKEKFYISDLSHMVLDESILKNRNYYELYMLHYILDSDRYNGLIGQIAKIDVEKISEKDKIKISFILYDSAMWCGNLLYNHLNQDPRFDVEILLCERTGLTTESSKENFRNGYDKLRASGIKTKIIYLHDSYVADADILFFLTPYYSVLNSCFDLKSLSLTKLILFMDYGMYTSDWGISTVDVNYKLRYVTWKEFVDTKAQFSDIQKYLYRHGAEAIYTGYPRMDTFYVKPNGEYDWKLVNQKAKKIIWAPHWSIKGGIEYATFQKNYRWFFEYAKSHPDTTSWVVKPHPNLMTSAVENGIFSDDMAFHEYFDTWNDLPNAKVETGAYYQDIFKTSDAMILDSCSFTLEYLYTHKPQLFLTRDTDKFTSVGRAVIDSIYTAEGDDFDQIKHFIQDVVIHGEDSGRKQREEVFRQNLDYYADLGQLASENIYQEICHALFKEEG